MSAATLSAFKINNVVTVADGLQRLEAHKRNGSSHIDIELRLRDAEDAALYAIHSNARHGNKLSREELRKAITKVLDDPDSHCRTNAEIAEFCGCSPPTVAKLRKNHHLTQKLLSGETRLRRNPGGGRSAMKVSNMGRQPQRVEQHEEEPTLSVRAHVRVQDHTSADAEVDTVHHFLDRLDGLQSDWNDPEALGTAVGTSGQRRVHRRFDIGRKWLKSVLKAYRQSRTFATSADDGSSK